MSRDAWGTYRLDGALQVLVMEANPSLEIPKTAPERKQLLKEHLRNRLMFFKPIMPLDVVNRKFYEACGSNDIKNMRNLLDLKAVSS